MWQDDILTHGELNAQIFTPNKEFIIVRNFILKYINYHIMCILY